MAPVISISSSDVTVISVRVTVPVPPFVIVILAPSAAADIPPPTKLILSLDVFRVVAASKSIISVLPDPSLAAVVNVVTPPML